MKELEFDVVMHLVGGQTIPNYMAVKLSEARRHVLVVTDETSRQFDILRRAFKEQGEDFIGKITVPATDYKTIRQILAEDKNVFAGQRVAVNITGGPKPMSTAALDLCREHGFVPFYIDTNMRLIQFFAEPYKSIDLPPAFSTVQEFLELAGYAVENSGAKPQDVLTPEKRMLLRSLWDSREKIGRAIVKFAYASKPKDWKPGENKQMTYGAAVEELERISQSSMKDAMLIGSWRRLFGREPDMDAAAFGGGVWLEQWLLMRLADSKNGQLLKDIRQGVKVKIDSSSDKTAQDIDIAFTDGYVLTLVECKAGYDGVKQEVVQKLENLRLNVGGVMGKGVIFSMREVRDEMLRQRISFGKLSLVESGATETYANNFAKVRDGKAYRRSNDY